MQGVLKAFKMWFFLMVNLRGMKPLSLESWKGHPLCVMGEI